MDLREGASHDQGHDQDDELQNALQQAIQTRSIHKDDDEKGETKTTSKGPTKASLVEKYMDLSTKAGRKPPGKQTLLRNRKEELERMCGSLENELEGKVGVEGEGEGEGEGKSEDFVNTQSGTAPDLLDLASDNLVHLNKTFAWVLEEGIEANTQRLNNISIKGYHENLDRHSNHLAGAYKKVLESDPEFAKQVSSPWLMIAGINTACIVQCAKKTPMNEESGSNQ